MTKEVKTKTKNLWWRPEKYTPEAIQKKAKEYFAFCEDKKNRLDKGIAGKVPKPKTLTGLCLYLWVSKDYISEKAKDIRFSETIERVRKKVWVICNKRKYDYKLKYTPSNRIKERRQLDINFKLKMNYSSLLKDYIKRKTKNWTVVRNDRLAVLWYNIQDLKKHLENKFKDGMNWSNYWSYWHIDHITPASWFNYNSISDKSFIECWSLDNLQPLTAKENMSKSNKFAG